MLEKLHQSLAASLAAAQQTSPKKGEESDETVRALAEALAGSMAQIATRLESTGETFTAQLAAALAAMQSQTSQTSPSPQALASKKAEPEAASAQLAPYLDGLNKTLAALARGMQGSGKTIVQTLPEGVHDLLDRTLQSIDERMIPVVRTLSKKVKASKDEDDQNLQGFLDGTLKRLDELRDLVRTLRKLDTRGVVGHE